MKLVSYFLVVVAGIINYLPDSITAWTASFHPFKSQDCYIACFINHCFGYCINWVFFVSFELYEILGRIRYFFNCLDGHSITPENRYPHSTTLEWRLEFAQAEALQCLPTGCEEQRQIHPTTCHSSRFKARKNSANTSEENFDISPNQDLPDCRRRDRLGPRWHEV